MLLHGHADDNFVSVETSSTADDAVTLIATDNGHRSPREHWDAALQPCMRIAPTAASRTRCRASIPRSCKK